LADEKASRECAVGVGVEVKDEDIGGYVDTLVDHNGVAVVTVSDGWVLTFTRAHFQKMLEAFGESDRLAVFVKSSAAMAKKSGGEN
jgi:hypothetical protein